MSSVLVLDDRFTLLLRNVRAGRGSCGASEGAIRMVSAWQRLLRQIRSLGVVVVVGKQDVRVRGRRRMKMGCQDIVGRVGS